MAPRTCDEQAEDNINENRTYEVYRQHMFPNIHAPQVIWRIRSDRSERVVPSLF